VGHAVTVTDKKKIFNLTNQYGSSRLAMPLSGITWRLKGGDRIKTGGKVTGGGKPQHMLCFNALGHMMRSAVRV
jgi:hypothetical protein